MCVYVCVCVVFLYIYFVCFLFGVCVVHFKHYFITVEHRSNGICNAKFIHVHFFAVS